MSKQPNKLDALLAEKQRRDNPPVDVLSAAFPYQREFILDPCRRKAAFIARRSGKSYMVGIYLIHTALSNPAVKCLYFGKTQDAARNVMWLHIIFDICERFKIPRRYNKTLQEITFNNHSTIKLTGADASDDQIEKALGGKYKLVIFDECQVIKHIDLERAIKARLGPAMVDQQGTIVMCGTAGDLMGDHYWYRVTRTDAPREAGWNVHTWPWSANPHTAPLVAKELEAEKRSDPEFETSTTYLQEWLCQWVVDRSGRIYKFSSTINGLYDEDLIKSLMATDGKWQYIFGMDFGFEDDTAIVVGAFNKHDPHCYIVDSFKKPRMLLEEIAETILDWKAIYKPVFIIGDAQNKTIIEGLRQRYRIPIIAAKKLGKESHIAFMNNDFRKGIVKVIERNNMALIKEWAELTWAEKQRLSGIFKENPSKDNHLADAALYLHHFSLHYRATPEPEDDNRSEMRKQAEAQLEEKLYNQTNNTGMSIYDYMEKHYE